MRQGGVRPTSPLRSPVWDFSRGGTIPARRSKRTQILGLLSRFPGGTGEVEKEAGEVEKEAGERADALPAVGPATNAHSVGICRGFHMTLFSPMKTRRDAFLRKSVEKTSVFKGSEGRYSIT